MKLIDVYKEALATITSYCETHKNISFLDIGADEPQPIILECVSRYDIDYKVMEYDNNIKGTYVMNGDICYCSHIPDESYDIVYSHNVFEHITTPWLAAEQCVRINKIGGLNIHIAPFAYDYHKCPGDYFRYTPSGFKSMFEFSCNMNELMSGFNTGKVACNANQKVGRWLVMYIGMKKDVSK